MTSLFHRRRFKKRLGLMALSTLLILGVTQVVAVEPKTPPRIHIEAEQMEVQQKTRTVRFTGKVSIRRDQLVLKCQALTGTYNADGQVVSLHAEGPVHVKGPDFEATAKTAAYTQTQGRLTLKGNPTLRRGQSTLQGRTITVWLDEERVVIDGAKGTLGPALLVPASP